MEAGVFIGVMATLENITAAECVAIGLHVVVHFPGETFPLDPVTGTICWQVSGTHMIVCMQALTISSRHLLSWSYLMAAAMRTPTEAVTGG